MSTKFKTVITTAGAAKLAAATVPGGKKVTLSAMAVGDGNGKLPVPDAGQTKLVHEVWRHALNKVSVDNKNKNYIVAELVVPPEVGGFWMRELGLYDDAGTLIAVANMAESYKPELAEGSGRAQTCRMVIIVSNVASVELSIDASTVMATQDYVDDKIAEHEQSRRHPDATLTEKGFTQLSSATNSTSEKLAATPKAVKAANDNANSRLAKNQNGADIQDKSAFLDNVGVTSLTFMKNNGEMPVDADLNTFGPVKAYLGIWSKATSTNATLEKNFPEDNAVGVLEVFAAGNFAGTQRFITRDGNVYMRKLANKWNGTDGPWGVWRHTQSATRPLSTTIDLNTLGAAEHLGLWRNSSSAIASYERNYPEEGGFAQGTLEILEGGNYGRTQRYTTRSGNMYVRCLAASWDASNPQWEPWLRVGHQSESRYYEGDLNVLTDPGIYSVTGKATNGPMLDTVGATLLGILEVIRRFDGVSVWQRYTTTGKSETTQGRTFERVYAGSKWTEWREVYNSFSLPLNLGIGGAVAKLSILDWQTYDFVPGSLITVRLDNMTNIPDGMDWGVIDGNLINIAVGPSDDSGTGRSMHVWRSTVSKANYRFFMVRISGNPGSRTITTRRVPIIDEAQTWGAKQTFSAGLSGELSGNAATATKLKTARKINNVSFDGTSDINLTPKNIGAFASGKTGDTVANDKAVGWNWSSGAYNATIGGASTLILHFNIGEGSCPAAQFRVNYKNGGIFYRSARDGYGFEADWSEFYTTTRKPTAGDVGALPLSGGQLNGALGIGTSSALGGNSIVLGDNDTGFKQNGDGNLDVYANSVHVMRFVSGSVQSNKTINITGRVNPSDYGNFDSRYVRDVRLGTRVVQTMQKGVVYEKAGHVITGLGIVGEVDGDDPAVFRPIQKYINGTWYNVAQV
ncbi:TPA: phage tail protein [Escherichia coli O25b:H4-ST131]|uniref:phage tail-collar fiber domain-containing protein n=1 Tax=Escherichia coli TaxID=562 RepID=UPI0020BE8ACE|nr:phage tail protein [Escherichia coli]URC09835.1 tail fiber protein [Escherichia phage vB_EcoM-720R8]HBN2385575.1 phage tail protein [Escherichia coli O25b:H4-ST131]MCL5183321.1 phage tail protein [Escherichia coli]HBN2406277.1 phage tail protein [Escherichia coli O25b:H4-ST131]HBU8434697.1 phage tail protein [Escherichia coli]